MSFRASFPAVPTGVGAIRDEMVSLARDCGVADSDLDDVALAVSEAATNALVHGYRGEQGAIHVSASESDGEFRIVIADDGAGLQPLAESPGLGLGLAIIAAVTRRMEVVTDPGRTEIRMVFASGGSGRDVAA